MKKVFCIGMVLLAVALVALAADSVTGKWTFEMSRMGRGGGPGGGGPGGPGGGGPGAGGPGGGAPDGAAAAPRIATLELKAEGAKLTGTLLQPAFGGRGGEAPPAPTPTPIANGKVDGNNISFDVTRESQMGSMTTKYKGVVNGSEMKLSSTMDSPMGGDPIPQEMTAKKQ
jgi:hypothetical protein